MILHAASIAAFFVGQLEQAPVVVHCILPPNSDPGWKQWIQPILNIASILAVLSIAIVSFGATSRKEHRRWVLDQKKIEWKELLDFASRVEQFMPSVAVGDELTRTVHDPLFRDHLRDMTQTVLKCIFISELKREKIYNSLLNVQLVNEQSKGHIEDHYSNAHLAQSQGKPRPLKAAQNVQSELIALWRDIRQFASDDMDIVHHKYWFNSLVGIHKKPQKPKSEVNASQDHS